MNLNNLLPLNHIIPSLEADTRREILLRMASPLVESEIVTNLEQFVNHLEEREDQITTQVVKDAALPHSRSMSVKRLGMSMALAPAPGLNFGPDPIKPCRIFFLIAIPYLSPTSHLPLLEHLAKFCRNEKNREKILTCKTKKQILKFLNSFKG